MFLTEDAYSHGGLQTRELDQILEKKVSSEIISNHRVLHGHLKFWYWSSTP